ncbi:MAG TPA: signal recognition particle receptor subunit alpha, partial [Tepidisphaeraceae bacterium]|nr:signal recognition particle receptor subunit alpha [Tepidisphaeraceae bacterium]
MGFFSKTLDKLKTALTKTKEVLTTDVRTLFVPGRSIDDAFLDEMEEKLIRADMGVKRVQLLKTAVRDSWKAGKIKNAEQAEGAGEGIEGADARAFGLQRRHDVERGCVAHVIGVRLEGEAEHGDGLALQIAVERVDNLLR